MRTSQANKFIPYSTQFIADEDSRDIERVLRGDWIAGNGPVSQEFELRLSEVTGYSCAVVVNSGTAALRLACLYVFGEQQEIFTTSLTFVATANAILYANKTPRFVDVNK